MRRNIMSNAQVELKKKLEVVNPREAAKKAEVHNRNVQISHNMNTFHKCLVNSLKLCYDTSIELVPDSLAGEILAQLNQALTDKLKFILTNACKKGRILKFILGNIEGLSTELQDAQKRAKDFKAIVADITKLYHDKKEEKAKEAALLERFSLIASWVLKMFQDLIASIEPEMKNGDNAIEQLANFIAAALARGITNSDQISLMRAGGLSIIGIINEIMSKTFDPKNINEIAKDWENELIHYQYFDTSKKAWERDEMTLPMLLQNITWSKMEMPQAYELKQSKEDGINKVKRIYKYPLHPQSKTKSFEKLLGRIAPIQAMEGMNMNPFTLILDPIICRKIPKSTKPITLVPHLKPINCTATPPQQYRFVKDLGSDVAYFFGVKRKDKGYIVHDEDKLKKAAANGDIKMVKELILEKFVDINGRGIRRGLKITVNLEGIECNVSTNNMTPLLLAIEFRRREVVQFLVSTIKNKCLGQPEKFERLMSVGVPVFNKKLKQMEIKNGLDFASASLALHKSRLEKLPNNPTLRAKLLHACKQACKDAYHIKLMLEGIELMSSEKQAEKEQLTASHRLEKSNGYLPGYKNCVQKNSDHDISTVNGQTNGPKN